jgi:hypothetical protein
VNAVSDAVMYYSVRNFDVIRIGCHHSGCGAVLELHPRNVEEAMKKTGACCPVCGKPFTKPDVEGGADVITMLAKVVLALNGLAPNVGIEFPACISN